MQMTAVKVKEEQKRHYQIMGAFPCERGIAFRVWAPNATQVSVMGTFNNFSTDSHLMKREDDGCWYLEVPEAAFGDEYKYCIKNDNNQLIKNDPYAREVTNSAGNSIVVDPDFEWDDDGFAIEDWNKLVIYEMHIGTFNTIPDGTPGKFSEITEKLSYLSELGVNVIQVLPPQEFQGGFSWGYNTSYPFALESEYGGSRAFKNLINEAHRYGIAVIVDLVYNHLGPADLDMWQFDGWNENEGGGIYFYNDWRARTPWGNTRPDYGRGEVRTYLRDNAMMWVDEYHLDGLRFDSVLYIRNVDGHPSNLATDIPEAWSILQWINNEVRSVKPGLLTIAEDLTGNEWVTKSVGEGGAGFNTQWDAAFVHPIRAAIITPEDSNRDMYSVRDAITNYYNGDWLHRVVYTESHDEVANGKSRVPEEIWPGNVNNWFSKKRSTMGAGLVFTTPGIPMLFQGQEFLEDRWFEDTDPLDWERAEQFKGLVQLYRDLIALRRNLYNTTRGLTGPFVDVYHVNNQDKLIAFHRWDRGGPKDSVVVIVNFANRTYPSYEIGFPAAGLWKVRFNSDCGIYDPEFGNHQSVETESFEGGAGTMPCHGNISIGPYSVLIFSQD